MSNTTAAAAKADVWFTRYIDMGEDRSLRGLAAIARQEASEGGGGSAPSERTFFGWSSRYGWERRARQHDAEVNARVRDKVLKKHSCAFDVSRVLQKPLPDAFGLAKTAAGLQNIAPVLSQQDAKRPPQEGERPPVVHDNDRGATGTARRDAGYTLTLTVTATDELLDMLIDVHAAAKLWWDNGLEVVIGE